MTIGRMQPLGGAAMTMRSIVRPLTSSLALALMLAGCVSSAPRSSPASSTSSSASAPSAAPTHPLDPLTADEIALAVRLLRERGSLPDGVFFPILVLAEPEKSVVREFRAGGPMQ